MGSAVGTIELDISKLQSALKTAQSSTKSAMDGIKQAGDTAGKSLGTAFEQAGAKMQSAGQKMTAVGGTLTKAVTLPLVGFGIAAFKSASDFETSMAKVSTIADGTQKPMQEMEKEVRNVAKTYGTSANEIAEATYQAISAGVDTGKSVAFVGEMNKLAVGGFTDVTTAVDTVTTVLNAYGLEAEDASHVSDVLIQTQNKGKTSVDELAGSIGKVIPIANANKISVEQLGQAYSVMTANGVQTTESTTMLKALFGELGKEGSKSADILQQKTGKSFKELSDEGMSLRDVLQIVSDGAAEQGKSFEGVFSSSEAASAGLVLMNTEQGAYNESLGEFLTASGDTEEAYAKMADTTGNKVAVAMQTLKDVLISVGQTLILILVPYIEKAGEAIGKLGEWWETLSPPMQDTIVKIGLVAAAIGPLLVVGGKLTSGIGGLVGSFGKLIPAIAGVGAPVIAIVAVVGVLIAAFLHLWKTNEDFRNAITGIWNGIRDSFTQLGQNITDTINSLGFDFQNFGQVAKAAWEGLTSILAPLFTAAFGLIANDLKLFVSTVSGVFAQVVNIIKTAVGVIKGIIDVFVAVLNGDWQGAWDAFKGIFDTIWQGIINSLQNFIGIFQGIWDALVGKISIVGDAVGKVFGVIGGWFGKGKDDAQDSADGISSAMDEMQSSVSSAGDGAASAFDTMSAQIKLSTQDATTSTASATDTMAADLNALSATATAEGTATGDGYSTSLASALSAAEAQTQATGDAIATSLKQTAADATAEGTATGTGYTDSLGSTLANATTVTQTATSGAVTSTQQTTAEMTAAGQQAGEGYNTGLNTGLQTAVTSVGTAMTGIVGATQVATTEMVTAGQSAGQGFAQGLNVGLQTAVVAVGTAMTGIVGAAKIATASMTQSGQQAGQGFSNGLKSGMSSAVQAVGIATTGMIGAAKTAAAGMTAQGQAAGKGFSAGIKSGMSTATTNVQAELNKAKSVATAFTATFKTQGQQAGQGFTTAMKSGLAPMVSNVQAEFNKAKSAATSFTSAMKSEGQNAGRGFSDGFKSGISSLTTNLQAELNKAKSAITSFASSATSQMRSAGSSMAQAVSSGFSGAANWSSLGAAVAQGIAGGISANTGAIVAAARSAAQQALAAAKAELGVASPSRVFRDEVGAMIPAGMAIGVERAMPHATRDMQAAISAGTDTLNTDMELTLMAEVGDTFIGVYEKIKKLVLVSQEGLQDSIQELNETKISGGAISKGNTMRTGMAEPLQPGDKPRDQGQGDTFVFNETGLQPDMVARLVRATKRDIELGFA